MNGARLFLNAAVLAAIVCYVLSMPLLRAQAPAVPNDSSSNAPSAILECQEAGYTVINWSVAITTRGAPFPKEPAAASGKIIRGVLNIGDGQSNSLPFIWQRDAGKLFLDLNRNQDFTDDPSSVYSTSVSGTSTYALFNSIRLPIPGLPHNAQPIVDLNFWDYGSQPGCNAMVHTFWQAKLVLNGKEWQIGIVQKSSTGKDSFEQGFLLLRPWDKRAQPFSSYSGSLEAVLFSKNLFFDGHAYEISLTPPKPEGDFKPVIQFKEKAVTLGSVRLTGIYIHRLVLLGAPYCVVIDDPSPTEKLPLGTYTQARVALEHNGTQATYNPNVSQTGSQLSVLATNQLTLALGGPLTNRVAAGRRGRDLNLNYELVGANGEAYQLTAQDRSKPPEFVIFKGGKQIASGKFEFG